MLELLEKSNVYNTLVLLLNLSFGSGHSSQLLGSDDQASCGHKLWVPSERDISAAVAYALAGLSFRSSVSKLSLLNCSAGRASTYIALGSNSAEESNAVLVTPPRHSLGQQTSSSILSPEFGSLCYRLLSAALYRGHKTPYRVLCVNLLESFLRGIETKTSSAASRIVVSTSIIKALRDSLTCPNSSPDCLPPSVFAALLDALASALLPSQSHLNHISVSPSGVADQWRSSAAASAKSVSCTSSLDPVLSVPELAAWVSERYFDDSPMVMSALLRLIGRLGNEKSYAHIAAARKLHANVLSSKVILVVLSCLSANESIDVRSLAALTMWTLLHGSESSRAILKDVQSSIGMPHFDCSSVEVYGELSLKALEVLHDHWMR
jgi:hypothetical protein